VGFGAGRGGDVDEVRADAEAAVALVPEELLATGDPRPFVEGFRLSRGVVAHRLTDILEPFRSAGTASVDSVPPLPRSSLARYRHLLIYVYA